MSTVSTATASCPAPSRAGLWSTSVSWLGKGVFAILDQGAIAASNFLISLLLARQVLPEQYGAYALAFELFLLLTVFYASFILEPMSVFGASVYRERLREYLGTILRVHLWVALGTLLVVGSSAWLVHRLARSEALAMALAGVAIAAPLLFFFWVARRAFYIKLAPRAAALGALAYCVTVLGGLALLYRLRLLSPFAAFILMGLGALVTGPLLVSRLKPVFQRTAELSLLDVVRRHWSYGRWALASSVATWAAGAVCYFALSGFHGLADTGSYKALLNLSSPVGQGFAALSLLSLPYASRVHHQDGTAGLKRVAWRLTLLYAGGTAAYFALVVLFRGPLLHLLYGGKYLEVLSLVPWVGLGAVLRIASTAQAIPLRASQSPYLVFVAYGASGVVAVLLGVPLIWAYGLRGAVFATVLSNATGLIVAWGAVRLRLRPFARV